MRIKTLLEIYADSSKTFTVTIDRLPDVTALGPNSRRHRYKGKDSYNQQFQEQKIYAYGKIIEEIQATGKPKPFTKDRRGVLTFYFIAGDNRKKDVDNCISACKAWVDALKEAGIIDDDNWQVLPIIKAIYQVGVKNKPKTIIEIKEQPNEY